MSSSPITQVSQHAPPAHSNLQPQLLTRLFLDLRGRRFEVDRETIMNLPESVLLCLFPNGLVLSRQSVALSDGGDDEDEEVYGVDVSYLSIIRDFAVSHQLNWWLLSRQGVQLVLATIYPLLGALNGGYCRFGKFRVTKEI